MRKKTILITGATRGMGKAAALALAKQGHHIIITGRKEYETVQVQQEIILESDNPHVDYILADLSLLGDIHQLAERFKQRFDGLDILIHNAGGIFGKERMETADAIEKTIALNFVAPYLLTALLTDELQKHSDARIVFTASDGHSSMAKPDFEDIELKQGYTAGRAYGNAKLFLIMMSQELDRKFKETGIDITVNSLHPGVVINQKMVEDAKRRGFLGKAIMLPLMRLLMKTAEQGADTIVYLASSEEVEDTSGLYFYNRKPKKVNKKYISVETKEIIWNYCETITGVKLFK
ncbi:NAD(P)-dependent dehydrogenase, short-chain alcohol dehydrogenase family [Porphyromonadaceae bacterium KH3CP3RA]|nr:NAD(P)-dependent dehydrogenase, short-chain alcohol dehydrogenase family [Porphyromonadaceae bacterium KH3CP3RA]